MRHPPNIVRRHRQDAMSVVSLCRPASGQPAVDRRIGGPDHRHSVLSDGSLRSTLGVLVLVVAAT